MYFCNSYFEVYLLFDYKKDVFKSTRGTYLIGDEFISCDLQAIYLIQKTRVLTKRAAVNALLRKPMVCIHDHLKSVLRRKFLIFDASHPDTLYLRQQGCEDAWLFFEAERDPRAKEFWKPWTMSAF